MSKPDYYLISTLARPDVPVRFLIGGSEATGMLKLPRGRDALYQVLRDDGHWHDLPDHAAPSLWRPLDLDAWPEALPEPAVLSKAGRFSSQSGRRRWDAMADQDAEAERRRLAIEAEIGPAAQPEAADCESWWLDEPLTYSPPGQITEREAEGRVMRSILTDGLRPMELPVQYQATAAALADLVHETITSEDGARQYFEPTPRDLADYLTAFAWFGALNPPALWHKRRAPYSLNDRQRLLVWRAMIPPLSYRAIAKRMGRSDTTIHRWKAEALRMVWRVANRNQPYDHMTIRDPMADLRARNRAARARQ